MPLGFEERFHYSDRRMVSTTLRPTVATTFSGVPLLGYDAVYSYRSGTRAKSMSTGGSYASSVIKNRDLRSQILARKQFLENFINSSFSPQNGPPSVFSTTDDGHPFATFKVRATQPYGAIIFDDGINRNSRDVTTGFAELPYPSLTDPFGVGLRSDSAAHPLGKQTYFVWPSTLFAGGSNPPTSQQIVPNSLKQTLGAGLIANTNPWAAKADLAVTVLELLTGNLPRILSRIGDNLIRIHIDWKLQTGKELRRHTNPGNEWLSYHFGWAPLISDVLAAVDILFRLHILLYTSDEARRHRGGDLRIASRDKTSGFTSTGRLLANQSPYGNGFIQSPYYKDTFGTAGSSVNGPTEVEGKWSKSVLIRSDYRFSARFHSGARSSDRERGFLDKALDLLGLDITPATLWNLAPWTWLLDWFSNIGTVAQNLSDLDWSNVLLDYAYLTTFVETKASSSVTTTGSWNSGRYTTSTPFISQSWVTTEKIREQASPYGFSVNWTGLNPFQLSILAALGMTRGR